MKIMMHYQYKFSRFDTHFVQFKEETIMQLGYFFLAKNTQTEISFITKILAADELLSHVTITLYDKSRSDLIVKINKKA